MNKPNVNVTEAINYFSKVLIIFILILTSIFNVSGLKVEAANGACSGTLPFSGTVGANNSAGTGFANYSNNFIVNNGFTIDPGTSQLWAIGAQGGNDEATLILKGTSQCNSFTFKDMAISLYPDQPNATFSKLSLVVKGISGNTLASYSIPSNLIMTSSSGVHQLSEFFNSNQEFNVENAASVEVNWKFAGVAPSNLNFENIKIIESVPPTVSSGTISSSDVSATGVKLGWTKATDNSTNAVDLDYRVYQSTTNNIGTVSNMEANGTALGAGFTKDINQFDVTGLSAATTYYFNVLVKDALGNKTAYTQQQVTTLAALSAPTVVTAAAVSNLKARSVTLGGLVTSDGDATITERGIVYGTSANPTTANGKVTASGTTGAFNSNLSGLDPNTTYHYRAFATNAQGTSYGANYTFTTPSLSNNANLSNLTMSSDSLSPSFSSGTTSYTATIPNPVSSITVTPTVADSSATLTLNGATVTSGVGSNVSLNIGSNTITTVVTAEDGTTKTYTIDVTRSAPTYKVSYNGNGSTGGTIPVDNNNYLQSNTVTVLGNAGNLVRTGFKFDGWNTAANGSGTNYTQGATFAMGTTNITLYAQWKPVYGVTYDANNATGGTVPTDSHKYEQYDTVTVVGNTGDLVRTGYKFDGWSTAANGGTSYVEGATFSMGTTNITLYAQWKPVYTITYNGNNESGGAVPSDNKKYEQSENVTVLGNSGNLVKDNHIFGGWNTQSNGLGTTYQANAGFTMGMANITLYAEWIPVYVVTYNGNNHHTGLAPVDSTKYKENDTVTVQGNTGNLVKLGYSFREWNTKADGSGTPYLPNATIPMSNGNIQLFAIWEPNYYVTYEGNGATGGSVPSDSNMYKQLDNVTVSGNSGNLVRTGYKFDGWNTAANGSGIAYAVNDTFSMGSANVTLYAQWTANPTYTIEAIGDQTLKVISAGYTSGTQETKSVTIKNIGTGNLANIAVAISGTDENSFVITQPQLTSLAGGDSTTFTVKAKNGLAVGMYTATVTLSADNLTPETFTVTQVVNKTVPSMPTNVTAIAGDREAIVRFDGPMNNGGSAITGYTVKVYVGGVEQPGLAKTGTSSPIIVTGLTNGTVYTFKLIATNSAGSSAESVASSAITPLAPIAPGQAPSTTDTQQFVVNVVDDANPDKVITQMNLTRTTEDGHVKEMVNFTHEKALESVQKLEGQAQKVSRIVIPDATGVVGETVVNLPQQAVSTLAKGETSLSISTSNAKILIPQTSLENWTDDLYFRIVPVKEFDKKEAIQENAIQDGQLQQLVTNTATISILGNPVTIETNMQNHLVTLTLPLPANVTTQQLEQLIVYIQHSDGTTEVKRGTIVEFGQSLRGVKFDVEHFSTFTLLYAPDLKQNETVVRAPYIQGYADGTFRPDANVTRAQMATMLALHLTNNNIPTARVSFIDAANHWAKDAIEFVKMADLFKGTSETTFNPNASITRAQMASVVVRWIEQNCTDDATKEYCTTEAKGKTFSDVNPTHWASSAIEKVNALGIMVGVSETTFNPNASLTRAQAVKVLNHLFGIKPVTTIEKSMFTDVSTSHWAIYEIEAAGTEAVYEIQK